jgi:2-oxoisovalerate dehydrogenase E2 component (dihydrolipoyl transacylase)
MIQIGGIILSKTNVKQVEVTVPHLAESLVEATVGKWLKQPGDDIEQYEVICELMTEKVNTEMPSPVEGKLIRMLVADGQSALVGEALCLIEVTSDANSEVAGQSAHTTRDTYPVLNTVPLTGNHSQAARYSPAVLQLANEHQIEIKQVVGTGMGGRITRKDIERYVEQYPRSIQDHAPTRIQIDEIVNSESAYQQLATPTSSSVGPLRSTGIHLSVNPATPLYEAESSILGAAETFIDVTPIRSTIASRMRQSLSEIPHAWTIVEVDVTNLVILRSKVKDEFARKEGINLTYLAFMIKAVVNAIKDYPIMNSVWAVDKIIVKRDINISLAIGTEQSVYTPVIKKADQKNIAGLAKEIDELTKKARSSKLTLADMQGGTFTVNNTGAFGSILSYPIINYPQAAIVTFESIVKRPVVIQDMIAVRSMVNLCLSLDHRILDGVICGRFLQRVKENLESYNRDTKLY